jgi:hypothetical protein
MQVKVVNGRVELRKNNGVLIRVVGYSNAVHAELHSSNNMLLILSETGKLELRTTEGNMIKEIAVSGIKKANFQNDLILLSTDKEGIIEFSLNS